MARLATRNVAPPKWPPAKRKAFAFLAAHLILSPVNHILRVAFCCTFGATPALFAAQSFAYPQTRQTNQLDDYHGVKVADPYRWLEDDNSAETAAWVEAQNKLTFGYLEQIPERKNIKDRLTRLWSYERYGVPIKEGGHYFFTKNDGLQNQSVLYVADSLRSIPRVLLDPNTLTADGTAALSGYDISEDGRLIAYGIATAGSDWQEWKVRDVKTAQDLNDEIKWVKFSSASWTKDRKGFFYSRYDEPKPGQQLKGVNYFQKLCFHSLGTPQSQDELIYDRPDHKDWGFGGEVTDDGRYLIIHVSQGTDTRNRIFYRDLKASGSKVVELLNDFDAEYSFIDNDGSRFWFRTDLKAPRGRVIEIDINKPERTSWKELIPQAAETLRDAHMLNNQFVANYLKDAHTQIKIFSREGRFIRELELPGIGSAGGFTGKRTDSETFYSFSSFTTPATIYHYDLKTGASTVFRQPKVECDSSQFETAQVFYNSKDGTRIPMFITHKKGLKLDGNNPCLLYGYGGFNISITPGFSVRQLVWLERGGVYAVANLRGGGEYGENWHQAGMKSKKQNVFDDFIAAAEWLVANKYTCPAKLAIEGRSNGGLLVGACMTQRPELFGAAVPGVGVMDMLRFHKFTIGWAWTSDYGSSDNADEFNALYQYSPLHHLKPRVKYPSTLVTTADHDDRVVPAHSFKFAARLQECQAGQNPVLIRIETRAGHGAGKPTTKQIEEAADELAFLVHALKFNTPRAAY
jgi:prolyl oligopeptidase